MGLFVVTTRAAWDEALARGELRPCSLETAGFIELWSDREWLPLANREHRGMRNLVLVSIRADRVRAELRTDVSDGRERNRLHGPLNVDAVVDAFEMPVGPDGSIGIPEGLVPWRGYFEAPFPPDEPPETH